MQIESMGYMYMYIVQVLWPSQGSKRGGWTIEKPQQMYMYM